MNEKKKAMTAGREIALTLNKFGEKVSECCCGVNLCTSQQR